MFARTQRLLLRPGWPEDAEKLHHAINDEGIVRNLARAPWPYGLEDARSFLDLEIEPFFPRWLIFRRTAGAPALVGTCGVDRTPDGEVEIGYWIGRDHWGLGYATEAAEAALAAARSLGHRQFVACHFVDNPASGRVLQKLGFKPTGTTCMRHSKGRGRKAPVVNYQLDLEGDVENDPMRQMAA